MISEVIQFKSVKLSSYCVCRIVYVKLERPHVKEVLKFVTTETAPLLSKSKYLLQS